LVRTESLLATDDSVGAKDEAEAVDRSDNSDDVDPRLPSGAVIWKDGFRCARVVTDWADGVRDGNGGGAGREVSLVWEAREDCVSRRGSGGGPGDTAGREGTAGVLGGGTTLLTVTATGAAAGRD
jgi:hypothetical protein